MRRRTGCTAPDALERVSLLHQHREEEDERALSRGLESFAACRSSALQPFEEHNPEHAETLSALWSAAHSGVPFERVSPRWSELGFQGCDPITDLRATGYSGLLHLQRFVAGGLRRDEAFNDRSKTFPLAIASINVTGALQRLLHLNTTVVVPGSPQPADEAVVEAFMRCLSVHPDALQQLHDRLLLHLAQRWQVHTEASNDVTIMDFPPVLAATFVHLGETLAAAQRPWHLPSVADALQLVPIETPALAFAYNLVLWVWSHICTCGMDRPRDGSIDQRPRPARPSAPEPASHWRAPAASALKIS